jgi:hypothetical protein
LRPEGTAENPVEAIMKTTVTVTNTTAEWVYILSLKPTAAIGGNNSEDYSITKTTLKILSIKKK